MKTYFNNVTTKDTAAEIRPAQRAPAIGPQTSQFSPLLRAQTSVELAQPRPQDEGPYLADVDAAHPGEQVP